MCDCRLFLSASGVDVSDILAARSMTPAVFLELEELLDSSLVDNYPMRKTFDEAAQDVYLILHSSGTTGLPKPLPIRHAQVAAIIYQAQLPEDCDCGEPGFRRYSVINECAGRMIVPFAPFNGISAVVLMCLTVFGRTVYVFGPADKGMGPADLLEIIEHGRGDSAFCPPRCWRSLLPRMKTWQSWESYPL